MPLRTPRLAILSAMVGLFFAVGRPADAGSRAGGGPSTMRTADAKRAVLRTAIEALRGNGKPLNPYHPPTIVSEHSRGITTWTFAPLQKIEPPRLLTRLTEWNSGRATVRWEVQGFPDDPATRFDATAKPLPGGDALIRIRADGNVWTPLLYHGKTGTLVTARVDAAGNLGSEWRYNLSPNMTAGQVLAQIGEAGGVDLRWEAPHPEARRALEEAGVRLRTVDAK